MRDRRFVAEHRGGLLKKEQHRQLMQWACQCLKHILLLLKVNPDESITNALSVAEEWIQGKTTVGGARKASAQALEAARKSTDPVSIALIRAAGHAVATAHMADHALGPALYGLKAINLAGKSVEDERSWQNEQLPEEIRELVLSSRTEKEKHFKFS